MHRAAPGLALVLFALVSTRMARAELDESRPPSDPTEASDAAPGPAQANASPSVDAGAPGPAQANTSPSVDADAPRIALGGHERGLEEPRPPSPDEPPEPKPAGRLGVRLDAGLWHVRREDLATVGGGGALVVQPFGRHVELFGFAGVLGGAGGYAIVGPTVDVGVRFVAANRFFVGGGVNMAARQIQTITLMIVTKSGTTTVAETHLVLGVHDVATVGVFLDRRRNFELAADVRLGLMTNTHDSTSLLPTLHVAYAFSLW